MEEIIIAINNYKEFKCVLENIEEHYEDVRWIVGIKPTEFMFDINDDLSGEPFCLIINSDKKIMWDRNNILDNEDNEDLKGFAHYTFDDFIETFVKKMGFEVVDDKLN